MTRTIAPETNFNGFGRVLSPDARQDEPTGARDKAADATIRRFEEEQQKKKLKDTRMRGAELRKLLEDQQEKAKKQEETEQVKRNYFPN